MSFTLDSFFVFVRVFNQLTKHDFSPTIFSPFFGYKKREYIPLLHFAAHLFLFVLYFPLQLTLSVVTLSMSSMFLYGKVGDSFF
jgi:hypothetical protein